MSVVIAGGEASGSIEALKASAKKDAAAQYRLGLACLYGRGIAQDDREAFKWIKKSVESGCQQAEQVLGYCYSAGIGTKASDQSAFKHYRNAALHGDVDAQYRTACCLENGIGTKQDLIEAAAWYQKSGEAGQPWAQLKMGDFYSTGRGVKGDYKVAAGWYQKAANQGLPEAQLGLASCNTLLREDVEAYKWLLLASRLGFQKAADQLEGKSYFKPEVKRQAAARAAETAVGIENRQKESTVPH